MDNKIKPFVYFYATFILLVFSITPVGAFLAVLKLQASEPIFIYLRSIILLASLFITMFGKKNFVEVHDRKFFFLFVLFYTMYITRIIYQQVENPAHFTATSFEKFMSFLVGAILIPGLSFRKLITPNHSINVFKVFVFGLFLVNLFCAYYYRDVFRIGVSRLQEGFLDSDSDVHGMNPLIVGYAGALLMSFSLFIIFTSNIYKHNKLLYACFYFATGLLTFSLGGSRGPVVVIISTYFILLFTRSNKTKHSVFLLRAIFVLVLISVGIHISNLTGSAAIRRFQNIVNVADTGQDRFIVWSRYYHQFLREPLFGVSLVGGGGSHPHNAVLEAFYTTGIFGGLIFIYLLLKAFSSAIYLVKINSLYSWSAILFINFFTLHMFSSAIWMGSPLACSMVLVVTCKEFHKNYQLKEHL